MGFLDLLNTFLPYIGMVIVGIVAFVGFLYYTKKYMPEIAHTLTKAYHSRALLVFLQDEMGNINTYICDKKFPEGIVHVKDKGWFLLPNPPPPENEFADLPDLRADSDKKRGPGRPPKNSVVNSEEVKEADEVKIPPQPVNLDAMSEAQKRAYVMSHGILVQTPVLKGFGKQVFFGSTVSVALSNLTAIAHAHIPEIRLLAPKMYQKTQLDALATGSRLEGLKMSGKEMKQWIFAGIIVIGIIACFAIAAWLLTNRGPAELALLAGVV